MPNGDGGGFGSRGEIEHTRTNVETQVQIPRMLLRTGILLTCLAWIGLYVIAMAVSLRLYDGPFLSLSRYTFWRMSVGPCWLRSSWRFLCRNAPLMIIPPIVSAGAWIYLFIRYYNVPKLRNPNWPPPFGQVAVTDVGALDWHNADDCLEDTLPEPRPAQKDVIVIRHVTDGKVKGVPAYQDRRIPKPEHEQLDGWPGFCRDIMNGLATFSEAGNSTQRGATDYGYTQPQYRNELRKVIADEELGYVIDHGKQGVEWLPRGREMLAQTVYDRLGVRFVPDEYLEFLPDRPSVRSSVREDAPNGGNGRGTDAAGDRGV